MRAEEYTWISSDGKKLFARSWTPVNSSKMVILLIHGLGEHCGRYERWAKLFNAEGFSVLSFDLRGHGKSEGKRGHAASLDLLISDIELLYEKSDEIFPEQKKLLYGHSMGGTLALNFIIRKNKPVNGIIITSPWLKLVKQPDPPTLFFAKILKNLLPALTLSNKLNPEQLSHDQEVIRDYCNDLLVHDRISLKMFHEIHNAGLHAMRNIYKINSTLLLMHGSADSITSPKASQEYVLNTHNKITFRLWEDQYHELHNELIYKEVFDFIIEWIRVNT